MYAIQLKEELDKALAALKKDHERRGELIIQVIPLLGELMAIEGSLPDKEKRVNELLRQSVNLPPCNYSISDYLDDFPVQANGPYEFQAVKALTELKAVKYTNDEIPF